MKLFTNIKGFCFIGKVTELKNIFQNYPPETTLHDFIRFNLH